MDEVTFDDLKSTFIEYISVMPITFNNEAVLRAYEHMFEVIDKLEDKYTNE